MPASGRTVQVKGFILDLVIGRIIVSVIIWIVSALLFSVLCMIIAPAIRMRFSAGRGHLLIAAFLVIAARLVCPALLILCTACPMNMSGSTYVK